MTRDKIREYVQQRLEAETNVITDSIMAAHPEACAEHCFSILSERIKDLSRSYTAVCILCGGNMDIPDSSVCVTCLHEDG